MKPKISIALITLGLTFPAPAQAVDYGYCDAIHRSAQRVHLEADAAARLALSSTDDFKQKHADFWATKAAYAPRMEQIRADAIAAGCPSIPARIQTEPPRSSGPALKTAPPPEGCKSRIECAVAL